MDRYWLLTWTTYGTWLPGDARGFVSDVRDGPGPEVRHNTPGTPVDGDDARVRRRALENLVGTPVWLTADQAQILADQFVETARYRQWQVLAVAIMANHVHLVVGVPGDPDPAKLLHDFKSYGTRALQSKGHLPSGGRWWTESGSRRRLPDERAVRAAVEYVRNQHNPLIVRVFLDEASGACERPENVRDDTQGVNTPHSQVEDDTQGVNTPRSPG
jgi:REP element-mobilizing transposase RayT